MDGQPISSCNEEPAAAHKMKQNEVPFTGFELKKGCPEVLYKALKGLIEPLGAL